MTTLHYPADFPDPNIGGGVLLDPYHGGVPGSLSISFDKPFDSDFGEVATLTIDVDGFIFSYRYTSADRTTAVRSFESGDNNYIASASYNSIGQRINVPQPPFLSEQVIASIPATAPDCIDSYSSPCYPFGGYLLQTGTIRYLLEVTNWIWVDGNIVGPEPVTVTISAMTGGVPEPATWATMILGIGFVGAAQRSRARRERLALV